MPEKTAPLVVGIRGNTEVGSSIERALLIAMRGAETLTRVGQQVARAVRMRAQG